MTQREQAPAKVNLLLQVGPAREDGLHELCSIFASIDLADELRFEPVPALAADEVVCPGVDGPNLVAAALAEFRERVDSALPPLRVTVEKRIPVAAGLAGGSADAAAALRAANAIAGVPATSDELRALAARLGSDVPSQVEPRHALVTGAGERVEPLELPALSLVLVPHADGLSAGEVYAEADRLGTTRERLDEQSARELAALPAQELAARLESDLEPAVLSLRPAVRDNLDALLEAGARAALVSGSGPTAVGVFGSDEDARRAAGLIDGAIPARLRTA
ncbi:MAG: 4-(cytidine 5'-diphospho)-2-C-methyl-D-erythritol kinase [Thermoleophilaceae bacterium]